MAVTFLCLKYDHHQENLEFLPPKGYNNNKGSGVIKNNDISSLIPNISADAAIKSVFSADDKSCKRQ